MARAVSSLPVPADSDVLIAGAGLVGLALATALARAGLRVAIADRTTVATPDVPEAAHDEQWDARIYAVSPGSARFLDTSSVWPRLPAGRLCAVETMHVIGDRGGTLDFSAYELGERALAWIVEERALRAALIPAARLAGVVVHAPVEFASVAYTADRAELHLEDGRTLSSRLMVAADGVRSWVREASGLTAVARPYGQTAVVANFRCERAHHGCARQWFLPDGGILAWLPLPGPRISIVWSAPEALARELGALSPEALAARVEAAGGHALGALESLTPQAAFPLGSLRLPTMMAHRLALVGDAAHGIHPLAGQGVNLGFGDAEALAAVLGERGAIDDPAAPLLLERYARRRAEPVRAMQAVTDGLARLFGARIPGLATVRNVGLAAIDRLPLARRLLAQPALR